MCLRLLFFLNFTDITFLCSLNDIIHDNYYTIHKVVGLTYMVGVVDMNTGCRIVCACWYQHASDMHSRIQGGGVLGVTGPHTHTHTHTQQSYIQN